MRPLGGCEPVFEIEFETPLGGYEPFCWVGVEPWMGYLRWLHDIEGKEGCHKGWRKHDDMEGLKMFWVCLSVRTGRCVVGKE